MKIKIRIKVQKDLQAVKDGFDESLFLRLNPPFPPVDLVRYDGNKPFDRIMLKMNFLLFHDYWESIITESNERPGYFDFVDEGRKLPFFLSTWKHRHIIEQKDKGAMITEDIQYSCGNRLFDVLLWPLLTGLFLYRVPVYKRVFKK